MSTYIDKKYIGMVSPLLKRFKWKKDNLANCRCPICGDSTKRKTVTEDSFIRRVVISFTVVTTVDLDAIFTTF